MKASAPASLAAQLTRDLRPDRLLPSLSGGLLISLLTIIFAASFAALIFSGDLAEFLPLGIGFMLVGDAILITIVALWGSHPCLVAIDQDAPAAILVTVIASALAALPASAAAEQKFATTLLLIISTTLLTGVFFILLGYFKLGGLIRFLPYPVIGGFLAGTGWLILVGAIGLMADSGPTLALLQPAALLRWLPGLALGLGLTVLLSRVNHPLTIPGVVIGASGLFYLALGFADTSLADARAQGWMLGQFPEAGLWQFPLTPTVLAQVNWSVLLAQLPNLAPILLISTVVMLLNISGVELIVKQDVDLNRELVVTGLSNVVISFFGTIIGFHTISLSGLNHRLGKSSRLASLIAAGLCVVMLFIGPLVLTYTPKFILGGMLMYLGLSFMVEWVVEARKQFPRLEYGVIWLILIVIAVLGFLPGVGVGLLAAVVLFVINYSRINVVKHALSGATFQSRVTRAQPVREFLYERGEQIHILQLQGYLFFGTAHRLLEQVRGRLMRADAPPIRFVVLDFRQVTGLDSTALLSFAKMKQSIQAAEARLVFTQLSPELQRLFGPSALGAAHEVKIFPDLDRGMEWCENELLRAAGVNETIASLPQHLTTVLHGAGDVEALLRYLDRQELAAGVYLIRQGDAPDLVYLVEAGQVTAQLEAAGQLPMRLETMRGGRVVGELGFYLGNRRTAAVKTDEPSIVYRLSLDQLKQMEASDPEAASTFHRLIVHLLAERVTHLIRAVDALLR
jgi:SulP family sulfate permease